MSPTRSSLWTLALGLWITANCLTHAGVSWRLIRPSNTGIPGDYCQTIFVDEQDHPWIAGYIPFWEEGGIAYPDADVWHVLSNVEYPEILSPRFNDVVSFRGWLWIGSNHGLLRLDPQLGPGAVTRFDVANTPMPGNQIVGIDLAPDGTLWIADREFGGSTAGGLVRHDPASGTWTVWNTANGLPWGGAWPGWDWVDFVAVTPDPDGGYTVWFGSAEMGMATWKDGVFTWLQNATLPPGEPRPVGLASADPVDELGNLWLITDQGVARRSPDGTYTLVGLPPGQSGTNISRIFAASGGRGIALTYTGGQVYLWDGSWQSLGVWGGMSHTYAFAEDSQGRFWVGGIGGAAVYDSGNWQRYRLTNTGMVGYFIHTIALGPGGDVAMNANAAPGIGGFDILHPDGTWTNANDATYGLGLPWGLGADDCEALAYRANGNLLFAPTFHGLYEFDGDSYTQLIPDFYDIGEIVEDGLGRIWAARGNGLDFIDASGNWSSFFPNNSPLTGGDTRSLRADPLNPGWIWLSTGFALVHTNAVDWEVYDRALFGYTRPTDGNVILPVAPAPDGTVWFGVAGAGNGGLFHFYPSDGGYVKYSPALGDPMPSDDVKVIDIAPDGSVWFNTFDVTWPYPGGVTHFDGETWTTYSADDSPLPHNQVTQIRSRVVPGGYEVWIGLASEAIAVVTVATAVPGDIDGDGDVDLIDLSLLLNAFGTCDGDAGFEPAADFDGSGCVDLVDLSTLLGNFGQ